jgi:hypothetical protein
MTNPKGNTMTATKTLAQLVAEYNALATSQGKPTRKSFDNKTKALDAIAALQFLVQTTPAATKGTKVRVRKSASNVVHNRGPRGFKVTSPAWIASIKSVKGICLAPANLPKLQDTAAVYGISQTLDQAEMVSQIAAALGA